MEWQNIFILYYYYYLSELDESFRPVALVADEGDVDEAVAVVTTGMPSFLAVTSLIEDSVFCSQLLRDCDCISIEIVVNWWVRS